MTASTTSLIVPAEEPSATIAVSAEIASRFGGAAEVGTQLGDDPVGDRPCFLGIRDRVEDDPEFVTAHPGDGVARTEAVDEPLSDGDQQPIADGMPEALVDDLEPVEPEQDHRDRFGVVRTVTGESMRDAVGEQLPVGQPGRRVVQRTALCDVAQPGVVEGDGRQLAKAGQCLDVTAPPAPVGMARAQAEYAHHVPARRERDTDHRAERARRQRQ